MLLKEFINRLIKCVEMRLGSDSVKLRKLSGPNHGYEQVTIQGRAVISYHPDMCSNIWVDSRLRTSYLSSLRSFFGLEVGRDIDGCIGE